MMRRFHLLSIILIVAVAWAGAVPALRQWQRHTQPDGTVLTVRLCGDEHFHYYETPDGTRMQLMRDGKLVPAGIQTPIVPAAPSAPLSAPEGATIDYLSPYKTIEAPSGAVGGAIGSFSGLFILVEFPDVKFSRPDIKTVYDSICNYPGYRTPPYKGSVRDYFLEQSDQQFDLTFDIVGPVRVAYNESRYGQNSGWGIDDMVPELVLEVIDMVKDSVDFSRYDWDGDGEADQVFLLYAGYGEAQYGPEWTIWPSEGKLSRQRGGLKCPVVDGITIDTFALSCELKGNSGQQIDGIGTICHEFSHCLGLPDFYNTSDMTDLCMGPYGIMDQGPYNGGSYQPAAYTGYERWLCGWREPVELTEPQLITDWQPLGQGGPTYIIYNEGDRSRREFYLLDNRQRVGFDASLYSAGLVVMHVDYDSAAWAANQVNASKKRQRCTLLPADGIRDWTTIDTDAYPYTYLNGQRTLDSLTNRSRPQATVYTANTDGSHFLNHPVYDICQNADLTMSFGYMMHARDVSAIDVQPINRRKSEAGNSYDLLGRRRPFRTGTPFLRSRHGRIGW